MGKPQNTIEINGKHYDAVTGLPIGTPVGTAMDGFTKSSKTTAHHVKREPQRASTLMRHTVKKPANPHDTQPGPSHQPQSTYKSPMISKFAIGAQVSNMVHKLQQPIGAKQPEPAKIHHKTPAIKTVSAPVNAHHAASRTLIDQALANAESHHQKYHAPKRRHRVAKKLGLSARKATIGSVLLAIIVFGTFFAYQNVPNFAMRVAATRAGFDASVPGYQPSGFSFQGPIKYSPGEVIVNFRSNTNDDRAYSLTQRKTDWDSDELRANYVQDQDVQFQTFLEPSKIVYTYSDGDASWVDDGVWYQLDSEADLTSDQILRIADSL